jgi:transposase InsO family protein
LRRRIREIAGVRVSYGYRRVHVLLRREGWRVNAKRVHRWAYRNRLPLDYIRPGKPTDNDFIESFNAQVRRECLSRGYFASLDEARRVLRAWREDYNNERPHGSLGQTTPAQAYAEAALPEDRPKLALRGSGCTRVG